MKLTKEQQVKRIELILKNENMTKCPHCNSVYLAMRPEFEEICADCNQFIFEPYDENIDEFENEVLTNDELLRIIKTTINI